MKKRNLVLAVLQGGKIMKKRNLVLAVLQGGKIMKKRNLVLAVLLSLALPTGTALAADMIISANDIHFTAPFAVSGTGHSGPKLIISATGGDIQFDSSAYIKDMDFTITTPTSNHIISTTTNSAKGNFYLENSSGTIKNATITANTPAAYTGGIYVTGDSNVVADTVSITFTSSLPSAVAISSYAGANVTVKGNNILTNKSISADTLRADRGHFEVYDTTTINMTGTTSNTYKQAIELNYGDSTMNLFGNINIIKTEGPLNHLIYVGTQAVHSTNDNILDIKPSGVLNINAFNASGSYLDRNGHLNIDGTFKENLTGNNCTGIIALSNSNVTGTGLLDMTIPGTNGIGIQANAQSTVTLGTDTIINVPQGKALDVNQTANVKINPNQNKNVNITGDIANNGTTSALEVNLSSPSSTFTGNAILTGGGDTTINVINSGTWTGGVSNTGTGLVNVNLDASGTWNVNADTEINDLLANNKGLLNMTFGSTYNTVKSNTLNQTDGIFRLDTDLQASKNSYDVTQTSDKFVINGLTSGTHYLEVKDASLVSLNTVEGYLLLVEDLTSGGATFKGKALETGGIFKYKPILTDLNPDVNTEIPDHASYTGYNTANAKNWYLTGFELDQDPFQPSVKPNLASGAERYINYYRELDSLLLRLGELRDNPNNSGIWARIKAGNESIDNIGMDSGSYTMFQVGYDHKYKDNDNGKKYLGFAVGHINSKQDYVVNATGEGAVTSFSIYDTWYGKKGHYLDLVAKAGRMGRDFSYEGAFPDSASSSNWYYSLSGEYGRKIVRDNGFYIEPQTQLTLGRINGTNYITDTQNITVNNDSINSAVWRIGTTLGKKLTKENTNSNIYAKAFWNHEFGGDMEVTLRDTSDVYSATENYGGSWWTLGLGANTQLDSKTNAYLDLEKSFGGTVKTKWQINAGVRWNW